MGGRWGQMGRWGTDRWCAPSGGRAHGAAGRSRRRARALWEHGGACVRRPPRSLRGVPGALRELHPRASVSVATLRADAGFVLAQAAPRGSGSASPRPCSAAFEIHADGLPDASSSPAAFAACSRVARELPRRRLPREEAVGLQALGAVILSLSLSLSLYFSFCFSFSPSVFLSLSILRSDTPCQGLEILSPAIPSGGAARKDAPQGSAFSELIEGRALPPSPSCRSLRRLPRTARRDEAEASCVLPADR